MQHLLEFQSPHFIVQQMNIKYVHIIQEKKDLTGSSITANDNHVNLCSLLELVPHTGKSYFLYLGVKAQLNDHSKLVVHPPFPTIMYASHNVRKEKTLKIIVDVVDTVMNVAFVVTSKLF